MKKTIAKPKFKTYIDGFIMKLGPLSIHGKMIGVKKSEGDFKPSFVLQSPDGNTVEQRYIDLVTGKPWKNEECNRVHIAGNEVTVTDKATLDKLKVSALPKNIITLTAHNAEEIDNSLFPSDSNAYLFEPDTKDPDNVDLAQAIVAAIESLPNKTLIGVCNFHGHEGLFRVILWRGSIVLQKQRYPEELNEHEVKPVVTSNHVKAVKAFIEKRTEAFNAENYRNTIVARQKEALANPELLEATDIPEPAKTDTLAALLESLDGWGEE
jgi:non-homologous end joining protein Ku